MTNVWVTFARVLRYLVPFVTEVVRNDPKMDQDDRNKAFRLKRLFISLILRAIFFICCIVYVFNSVIPLYSRNATLEANLSQCNERYEKTYLVSMNAQKNSQDLRVKLTSAEEEEKRLRLRVEELIKEVAAVRSSAREVIKQNTALLEDNNDLGDKLNRKDEHIQRIEKRQQTPDKESAISEDVKRKLKSIK